MTRFAKGDPRRKTAFLLLFALALTLVLGACGQSDPVQPSSTASAPAGKVLILYTSDVHCGVDQGFGYAGVQQIRERYAAEGYETILVDGGDAIQGEPIGTLSKGEAIIDLMNALHYDVALPGNHEFDYGVDHFMSLAKKAEFPYISCNFNKEGTLLLPPYIIKEAAGLKIAFVGVITPNTVTSSTPSNFQNEKGEYIYDFMGDLTGEKLYAAVQDAVDAARAEGADYVYLLGHLGMNAIDSPWTYADVIANTSGVDVLLDGHSHDTEQVVMKNKVGASVVRSACGTKMANIGYSILSAENGVEQTALWSWNNGISAPELFGIRNGVRDEIEKRKDVLKAQLDQVAATSSVSLTIYDPVAVDNAGKPVRMVRRAETNLGDLCADAVLQQTKADVALVNGGGIRVDLEKGDITYDDVLKVFPFGNEVCVIEATGQQILNALEWSASALPDEFGGFLQVAGLSYEIRVSVPSGCVKDENGMCTGIEGERRVQNVKIAGEPLDPEKTYKVAGSNYLLLQQGDGYTAFDGCRVLQVCVALDNQVLIDYLHETLGGTVDDRYADPTGQGRIVIVD